MARATDDAQLMTRYAAGDVAAFETLYARHKGPLYRYFFRQLGNPDTADELFQDVWIRIITAREPGESPVRFTTRLYRMAHNSLMDHFRKAGRSLTGGDPPGAGPPAAEEFDPAFASSRWSLVDWELGPGDESPEPEATSSDEQRASRLRLVLDTLPIEQREAFLLHEEAKMDLADIAAVTGAKAEVVQSHLRNVVTRLRSAFGDMAPAATRGRA